jgi:PAS domain S-box-containing protein
MEAVAVHAVGVGHASRERIEIELDDRFDGYTTTYSDDAEAALAALEEDSVDCVVCTPSVHDGDVLGFRSLARERGSTASFVLFDGERAAALDAPATVETSSAAEPVTSLVDRVVAAVAPESDASTAQAGPLTLDPERLQPFADAMPDPIYVLDGDRRFALVNEAFLEYVDADRGALLGTGVDDFLGRDEYDASQSDLEAVRTGEQSRASLEVSLESDGELERVTEANVGVQRDDDGTYAGSVGILRDVTERIERERELARYEAILETTPIGIFAVDENGTMLWCNEAYPRPFHFTREELIGAPFSRIIEAGYYDGSDLEEYFDRVRHLLSSENDDDRLKYTERIVDVDGNARIFEVTLGLLPLEDGEFAGSVQAFREITEERRYRRELERQNQRLENFASFVSHDLRNPLNVAQGYLDLLAEDTDDERVEELAWSLDRMEELIGDLLTLAREGKAIGETEPTSLEAIARRSWETVDTPEATLVVDGDATIEADPDRLQSLFENLFRNAVEHGSTSPRSPSAREDAVEHGSTSPPSTASQEDVLEHGVEEEDGGVASAADGPGLTVTVGSLDTSDVQRDEGGAPAATTGFYVADDGVGLPTDEDGQVDQSLFEVGYTTNESGTGFGTGIVKEIVDAHDWSITAGESEAGGALFEIRDVRSVNKPEVDADND